MLRLQAMQELQRKISDSKDGNDGAEIVRAGNNLANGAPWMGRSPCWNLPLPT